MGVICPSSRQSTTVTLDLPAPPNKQQKRTPVHSGPAEMLQQWAHRLCAGRACWLPWGPLRA